MASGVESGLVAVTIQAHRDAQAAMYQTTGAPDLTPNAIKAFMEYTAFPMHDATGAPYDALSDGAGHINGQGVVALVQSVDTTAPVGSPWLVYPITELSTYDGVRSVP